MNGSEYYKESIIKRELYVEDLQKKTLKNWKILKFDLWQNRMRYNRIFILK